MKDLTKTVRDLLFFLTGHFFTKKKNNNEGIAFLCLAEEGTKREHFLYKQKN
jgi:hypothetical protein